MSRRFATNQKRPASIQDVAGAAGCSAATVSRVLNNPEMVSPATAEKVRKAVAELSYRPNPFAKGLMTRSSRVLALLLPKLVSDLHTEVIRAAESAAERNGFCVLLARDGTGRAHPAIHSAASSKNPGAGFGSPDGEANRNGLAPRSAPALHGPLHLTDGVMQIVNDDSDSLWRDAYAAGLPVVLIDPPTNTADSHLVDRILIDDAIGVSEATGHLLASGVSPDRIHFVSAAPETHTTLRRTEAFMATLRSAGVIPRKDQTALVPSTGTGSGASSGSGGYMWAAGYLSNADLAGRAVLTGSDEIALGVLQAAQDHNIRVPDQLRIIGFGDTRLAPLVRPSLSTVRVPLAEAADAAIDLLIARMSHNDAPPATITISTRLFIRESSDRSAASGGF